MTRSNSKPNTQSSAHLQEFSSADLPLTPEAYALLRSRYAGRIDVAPTDRMGTYRVTARGYVGRVGLPGGLMLVIRPKIEVANLFYMLAVDASPARFYPPPTGLTPDPDIFAFIVAILLDRTEHLLRSGLFRSYVPSEDDLPFVRGRILLSQQVARHADLKERHVCAYADLTPDTPENRVLLATLRLVPSLARDHASLVHRARALLPRFDSVTPVTRSRALALLPGISYHRLNSAYAPVLSLCALVLRHLTLDENAGPHPFASFLVDMARLFESFLTLRLRVHLARHGLRVVAQRHDYLDETRQVSIRPDILVYPARSGSGTSAPLLVVDAKYHNMEEGDLNRDLYQLSAYLDRYNLDQGVLVYPRTPGSEHTELRLRGTRKSLHLATVDLSAPTPAALEESSATLSARLAALVD